MYWQRMGVYRVFLRKPEGKRPHGRPRQTWEDNIKIDLHSRGWLGGTDWIHLHQDRDRWQALAIEVMNLQVN
jgi:hypothetical protein